MAWHGHDMAHNMGEVRLIAREYVHTFCMPTTGGLAGG
jgi:hypothetical protein